MNIRLLRFFTLWMILWAPGALVAADRLPTSSCQERDNLLLLHRCNPYRVSFRFVTPDDLVPKKSSRSYPAKVIPKARSYRDLRVHEPFLERLVEKYIDYKERLLRRRPIPRGSLPGAVVGKRGEKRLVPEVKKQEAPESNVTMCAKEEAVGKKEEAAVNVERNESNISELLPRPEEVAMKESAIESIVTEPPLPHPAVFEVCREREELPLRQERGSWISPGHLLRGTRPVPSGMEEGAEEKEAGLIVYEVRRGDSFIRLARRYDTTVYDLLKWNGLSRKHLLKIGERLKIYPGRKSDAAEIKRAEILARSGRYRVRKGDTLIGIARRFGVDRNRIRQLNHMKQSSHVRLGETLLLPIPQEKIDRVLAEEKRHVKEKRRFKYVQDKRFKHKLRVTATAYTSHRGQTDKTPFLAAWNNRIRPGMKIIAVSNDLIRKYGITNGTKVKISGLPGIYTVRDKMHAKWRRKIDIYMGTDRRKALRWGRRQVMLYW